jgi:hypothetical protein
MYRRAFESFAVFSLSAVVTVLAVAAIVSVHPRMADAQPHDAASIVPAVFVAAGPQADGAKAEVSACPYLAALAAASKCPAVPKAGAGAAGCPFLEQRRQPHAEGERAPVTTPGLHT